MIIFLCMVFFMPSLSAQDTPFQDGEQLNYEIHYKYGIVMVKAGAARYRVSSSQYGHKQAFKTSLDFKTSSFFDKIFKVRDTLDSYMNFDLQPMYHKRSINEGSTKFIEELFVKKHSKMFSEVRVRRATVNAVKFDTLLTAENRGYDILSIFSFARTLDFSNMQSGQSFPLTTFVGKRKVNMIVRFMGQSIIEKSETIKYRAFRIEVDIVDEVFNESKSAMEIWISDDENRVPLKLKAKLKIGAAEANLTSYKGLKYPLTSEVRITPRK